MIDLELRYFEWLLTCLEPDGVTEEVAHVGDLLHRCVFRRRVGRDINRAVDGAALRKEFVEDHDQLKISPHVIEQFMMKECSWFEMLVALARTLDFTYDGGVEARFIEMVENLGLEPLLRFSHTPSNRDQHLVDDKTSVVDNNLFDEDGHGGIFPLTRPGEPDQRTVEIWDQAAAYFRERLEGVLWTSTS